ncbi:hypothetical protein SAMN02745146_0421 [Hymenobacter daecheongensis DSM 21074]|uniref:7(1) septoil knot domain-containing protein n=1 Tax=Hymenobacter daecheongensis DSM 21074 TaxID=1121955 RepID=A0A1M5ZZZ0_9BACT|nr:hypothetical protein [Hymenobacter daecheongensis]SHI29758.1 hypothetical protein SAMN02745146_0421 [Hymenobacter daecheongensis DSM 21074]
MLAALLVSASLALNPIQPQPRVPFVAVAPMGSIEPCRIYGSVFLETNPARRGFCFATVYLESEEAFADVLVYREDNKLFADKAGFWYSPAGPNFADYVLFVTENRALADFSIHYTDVRSFAGCRPR